MDDVRYQVLITGQPGQQSSGQVISAFAHLFCISSEEAAAKLANTPFVARGRLTFEQAEKYCRVIRRQGIQCELRPQEASRNNSSTA